MMINFKEKILYGPSFQSARVEEHVLRLPAACAGLAGRTLLFLSDVHLSKRFPAEAVEKLLFQIKSLQPDLILMGGDYGESADWQLQFFEMLSRIAPPLGIFGVLGNNDYECFPERLTPLMEAAARAGVTLLIDRTVRIDTGCGCISIAGLNELRHAEPLKKPLFTGKDASSLRILLAHYPQSIGRYLREHPVHAPHFAGAGHTHGGQFSLFGLTPYSIGFEFIMKGERLPLVSGWKQIRDTQLLVSPGLGTSRLPIRINVEPTIHRIQLSL